MYCNNKNNKIVPETLPVVQIKLILQHPGTPKHPWERHQHSALLKTAYARVTIIVYILYYVLQEQ